MNPNVDYYTNRVICIKDARITVGATGLIIDMNKQAELLFDTTLAAELLAGHTFADIEANEIADTVAYGTSGAESTTAGKSGYGIYPPGFFG